MSSHRSGLIAKSLQRMRKGKPVQYETPAAKRERTVDKVKLVALERELAETQERNKNLEIIANAARVDKLRALGVRFAQPPAAPSLKEINVLSESETAALFRMRDEEQEIMLLPMDERAWLEDHGFGTDNEALPVSDGAQLDC